MVWFKNTIVFTINTIVFFHVGRAQIMDYQERIEIDHTPQVAKYHFTCLAFYNKMKSVSPIITTKMVNAIEQWSTYG